MPHTLVKTVEVPRFTIRTTGGVSVVMDSGVDDLEAAKPSRRTSLSSEDFFEMMKGRGPDIPEKLKQFFDEIDGIGVQPKFLSSLNLKWDQPDGKPVNLGYIRPSGEIWTEASFWQVDDDLAEAYNSNVANIFDGKVRSGGKKKDGSVDSWVTRRDGTVFRIEDVVDRLSDWRGVMEDFQNAIRTRAQDRDAY